MREITLNLFDDEIAVAVADYEGRYIVTTYGRVLSLLSGKFLKGYLHRDGYLRVDLRDCNEPKRKHIAIHRLVARAFLPEWDKNLYVDHINGIRTDNRVENLRMCTPKENSNFELAIENLKLAKRNENSRNRSKAVFCVELNQYFHSGREAAKAIGRPGMSAAISMCCRGIIQQCYGYHWRWGSPEEIQQHS